jgi:hypothetical protein
MFFISKLAQGVIRLFYVFNFNKFRRLERMKLKRVVASLIALGLATVATSGMAAQGKVMRSAGTKFVTAQTIVDQNSTSVISQDNCVNWFDRITIGGKASGVAVWGNHYYPGAFTDLGHSSDLYLNNVNLIIGSKLNEWIKFSGNLAYNGQPSYGPKFNSYLGKVTGFERNVDNKVTLDEAYITVSDFAKTPFYAQVGLNHLPFGDYSDAYVAKVVMPMTQLLAQVSQPAVVGGFVADNGLYANVYAFRGVTDPVGTTAGNIRNFGASIGYHNNLSSLNQSDLQYNLHFGWIRQIVDGDNWMSSGAIDPIGGFSAHADVAYQQLGLVLNFVKALNNVFPIDYESSRVWAADATASYAFKTLNHDSKVGLSYQFTGNGQFLTDMINIPYFIAMGASDASFPHSRWVANYKVNLIKSVDADFALVHNRSYTYPVGNPWGVGAGNQTSNAALARLFVTL